VNKIGSLLEMDLSRDEQVLQEVVDGMDKIVFDEFVRRRSDGLVGVIQGGILKSGIDWLNAPKPTGMFLTAQHVRIYADGYEKEVRPYMHQAILLLVETHARVGNVAPGLVGRVLEALVEGITQVALGCFQQIPEYGTGGMLTVSLTLDLLLHSSVYTLLNHD
jgi:exocyst complex component 2